MISSDKMINLIYSPEFTSRVIHRFISGAMSVSKEGVKFELVYLLLPLIMNEEIRSSLLTVNKSSSFDKILESDEMKRKIFYLDEDIKEMKEITSKGIVYLSNLYEVKITPFLSLKETSVYKDENKNKQNYYRASYYLGMLFAKENYIDIFLKTKVRY